MVCMNHYDCILWIHIYIYRTAIDPSIYLSIFPTTGPLTKLSKQLNLEKGYLALLIAAIPVLLIFVMGGGVIIMYVYIDSTNIYLYHKYHKIAD